MSKAEKVVQDVEGIMEKVPALYEDALQPTTKETGKLISLIPKTINAALAPLRIWIAQREYNVAETEKLLNQKLEKADYAKIVSPEPYIAVPTIQAISYCMDSKELRELYANLLAKSMYSETKEFVHPSFIEIIKQMSPLDAVVFRTIMEREANPLITLIIKDRRDQSYEMIATNITDIDTAPQEMVGISIDNLIKQNLISVNHNGYYTDEKIYDSIFETEYFRQQMTLNCDRADGLQFSHIKQTIEVTNLGRMFYSICVEEIK